MGKIVSVMEKKDAGLNPPAAVQVKENPVHMLVDTPGKRLYLLQVACLISKDVEKLVDENYNENAILVSANSTVIGKPALKQHFMNYLSRVDIKEVKSTDVFVESGDALLFEATIETSTGIAKVYDAFVLQAGKISYHFTGVKEQKSTI